MLKISDGRKHFWQWDLSQKLLVKYENVCHVHFEDPDGDVALTVETYDLDGEKVADVPNILLQKPQTIHAYVYKCEGDECTIKHTYFNVYERQRPADYVYTETEVKRWETLEERIAVLEQGGSDGFSPTVDIEPIDGGHRISITDNDGTQTADVMDGRDGKDGDPGADGISPTVEVQDITGGHRVTITDKVGEKTFDVMDGKDGAGGSSGASVQSDWSVNDENDPAYVKNRTHWVKRPYEPIVWDGNTEGRDFVDVSLALGYPAGSVIAYKISDHVLTLEEIGQSTAYTTHGSISKSDALDEPMIVVEGAVWLTSYATSIKNGDNFEDFANGSIFCTAIEGDFTDVLGVVIPSTGTYSYQNMTTGVGMHAVEISADTYHTIDKRYLPAAFASEEYVDNAISQAIIGAIGGSY